MARLPRTTGKCAPTLQAGLRIDYQRPYGLFVLLRFSALYRPAAFLSVRAGGGFGYQVPTIFSSTTEPQAYVGVLPLNLNLARVQAETSRDLSAGFSLCGQPEEVSFSQN